MKRLLRRLHYLLNRRRMEQELADDLEFHREMTARDGGRFGNVLRLREESRDAWGWTWIDRLAQDLRYGARVLMKSPGFALAAIAMLAIGIGVNVAAFGFFDLMVLRPLNIRDPQTLMRFHRRSPDAFAWALPVPELMFFRENSRTLSAVLAKNITKVSIDGEEKQPEAQFVTANFFSELGATAHLGRLLDPARDEAVGADPVVVIAHGFWQRHFGSDPQVVGQTLRLNGKPATIIGVASTEFSGLSIVEPALWTPLNQQPYFVAGSDLLTDLSVESSGVQMWGRLAPGVTPAVAEAELGMLAAELRKQHPKEIWEKEALPSDPGGFAKSLRAGNRRGTGAEDRDEAGPVMAIVGSLVLLVLVVACANLGSLLLARGVSREREMSIRAAVGAGRGRLVRQLFTESLLLAMLGALAGLALGSVVMRGMMTLTGVGPWMDPTPDWRVVAFAAGAGCLAAIVFGLAPALQVAKRRHRANVAREFLVGAQVAASCVLLIVAGLLGRALTHVISANPGFEYEQVVSLDLGLARHGYNPPKARAYLDTLQARLRALPGVESVSTALVSPFGNTSVSAGMTVDGRQINMQLNHVDPEFFSTMKIPLLLGRNLTAGDAKSAIVSESLARLAWPGQDPLGKQLVLGDRYIVVGVAGNARTVKLEDSDSVEAYLPIEPADAPSLHLLVKASTAPNLLAPAAIAAARDIAPDMFPEVRLLKTGFRRKLQNAEYTAAVVAVFGAVAHLLACLGIVGVVAYAVSQRTKEIGIRMALGARPVNVLSLLLRQFSRPVVAGMLIGVCGAAALSQLLRGQLYGISNFDPASYLIAIAVFVFTVAGAALLPARRATGIDPLRALRYE